MSHRRKKAKPAPYQRELQHIIDDYVTETGETVVDMRMVAAWAIRNKRWDQPPADKIKRLSRDLSDAARQEYIVDESGEPVRRRHAWKEKQGEQQLTFWVDIEDATPHQMRMCSQQRRNGIIADCIQLDRDVGYYNRNYNPGDPIPLGFDFTQDVIERKQPTEYPDGPPDDDTGGEEPPEFNPPSSPNEPQPPA